MQKRRYRIKRREQKEEKLNGENEEGIKTQISPKFTTFRKV